MDRQRAMNLQMVLAKASPSSQAHLVWDIMRVPDLALMLLMFQTLSRILARAILHALFLGTMVRLATCWPHAMQTEPAMMYAANPVPVEVVL